MRVKPVHWDVSADYPVTGTSLLKRQIASEIFKCHFAILRVPQSKFKPPPHIGVGDTSLSRGSAAWIQQRLSLLHYCMLFLWHGWHDLVVPAGAIIFCRSIELFPHHWRPNTRKEETDWKVHRMGRLSCCASVRDNENWVGVIIKSSSRFSLALYCEISYKFDKGELIFSCSVNVY